MRIVPEHRRKIQVGQRFERLVLDGMLFYVNHCQFGVFRCDCGKYSAVFVSAVSSGLVKSCGCLKAENSRLRVREKNPNFRHGESRHGLDTKLYQSWCSMKYRCKSDKWYVSRGIAVCDEWAASYEKFREWAAENGFRDGLTLDRINNDGNYEPSNCRWTTAVVQANNRRTNVFLVVDGESKTIADWARDARCAVSVGTLQARHLAGWKDSDAVLTPPRMLHNGNPIKRRRSRRKTMG